MCKFRGKILKIDYDAPSTNRQLSALRDVVPVLKTLATAACGRVLGVKYGIALERGLAAIPWRLGWREAFFEP